MRDLVKCPKNPSHKKFRTTAHVMQEWLVDAKGEFLGVIQHSLEVSHGPDLDNLWRCAECGAQAVDASKLPQLDMFEKDGC